MLLISKGSKEALTVLIVTHVKGSKEALTVLIVTHVKGVKRSLNSFTHNFLNIQPIFNLKKVLESWDLDLSNHTIQWCVYWRGRKLFWLLTPSTCFDIHSIGWYGWKGQSLRFPKLFWIENRLNIKKVMSKNVMSPYSIFWRGQKPLDTEYNFDPFDMSEMTNIILYTVLCKSHKHYFQPFQHE